MAAVPQRRASPRRRSSEAAIEAFELTKRFGRVLAVDRLTSSVPQGRITAFVGANGAGKTTTIRMLLGLVRPSAGTGTVLGSSIADPSRYVGRVGALVEGPAFYPPLSGRRNLRALALLGGHPPSRVEEALETVGLAGRADDRYRTYSLGMKQRLGIAAALLPDPQLLLLDEPTNGLDPAGIRDIRTLLLGLARRGKTIFVSSHLMAEVQRLCDHLIVVRKGRAVFQGPVQTLLAKAGRAAAEPDLEEAVLDILGGDAPGSAPSAPSGPASGAEAWS